MKKDYSEGKDTERTYNFDEIDNRIIKDIAQIDNKEIDEVPLGFFIEGIYKYYSIYINTHLKNINLTPKQIYILLLLSNEENINQESIASILNSDEVTMTREITNLEKNEYVTRKIDEKDRVLAEIIEF